MLHTDQTDQSDQPAESFASPADRQTAVSLDDVRTALDDDLKEFQTFFKETIRTDVFLLNRIISYLLRMKGKQMRPILVFLSAQMCGRLNRRTHVAAAMIELLHTATLIHDDVVDNAEQRRGFKSINTVWKNKASVLLGDFLLSKGLLVALDNEEFEFLRVLSATVKRMSEGELRQLKASKLLNMTEEKYFRIISEKTASLLSACCECGAISSDGTDNQRHHLRELGENLGIAFQIRDDLFDYGVEEIGKPKGNDIRERKITLPLIAALKNAGTIERHIIKRTFRKNRKSGKDVERIRRFVHEKGGINYAQQLMSRYAEKAYEHLDHFPECPERENMRAFIGYVVTRKK